MDKWKKQGLNPDADANPGNKISRKKAIEKAGKYAAFTAAIVFLSPKSSQATSVETKPAQRGRNY